MPWLNPKTNWDPLDFMQYEDWLRITGNLQYLKDIYYIPGRWRPMLIENGKNGYPTVEIVNNLEENLNLVRNYLRNQASVPYEAYEWFAKLDPKYIKNPNYDDYNRWERYTQEAYLILKGTLVSDTFFAGNNRTVQKFSRGRIEGGTYNARRNFR